MNTFDDALRTTELRCLLIASTFPPIHGGSAVVYANLCQHLPKGSVRVLTAKKNYLSGKEIEGWQQHDSHVEYPVDRIELLRPLMAAAPRNRWVSLCRLVAQDLPLYARAAYTAAGIVYKHRINVVCVGELVSGSWLGILLKKIFGCKLIIYVHGEEITTATAGLHGKRRSQYLAAADKVVAVSAFTCDALMQTMGVRAESIELIHNGVDTDKFSPGPADASIVSRHKLQGKKIVLTLGRLVPRKGMDMAIRAMKKVIVDFPDARHIIIGEGEYRDELLRIVAAENMGQYVSLVGKISDADLLAYMRSCDVFLLPNRTMPDGDTEGFGLVFREANACGKPVVGGRAGGVVEAVVDGYSGVLVDGNDPSAIAVALCRFLQEPALALQMGLNGLILARENNTEKVADRFLKSGEELLATAS